MMACGLVVVLVMAFVPAFGYTPEELMGERVIQPPKCADGVCTIREEDWDFVAQRGRLMEEVATRLYNKLNSCRGGRNI